METKCENIPNNSENHKKYYQNPCSYEGLHVIHMSELNNESSPFDLDPIHIEQYHLHK